jgi:hypothetical protein
MTNIEWATWAAAVGSIAAAAIALGIALWSHRNELNRDETRRWEAERDRQITDLDETRRLLQAVMRRRDLLQDPILFGTLVNAIAKHAHLMEVRHASDMLDRWYGSESGLDRLEELVSTIDARIVALGAAPVLSPLAPTARPT